MDDSLKQLLTLGQSHFEAKQYTLAEQYLSQVVERNQSFADVYNMLGLIFHQQGQFAKAQRSFESALKLNPAYTEASLNLAVIYNDLGKYREAREVYQAALLRQRSQPGPLDPFVKGKIANKYADIGDVYASSGMWAEAIGEYRRALALCPQFADIRLKLASACRDAGDAQAAISEIEEITRTHPEYMAARVHYGIALFSAGRKGDALRAWEMVLSHDPSNKSAAMYLSLAKEAGRGEP